MGFVFLAESLNCADDGGGGGFAQPAEGCSGDGIRKLQQQLDIPFPPFSGDDALQNFQHALGAFPAGDALAAGFVLGEVHEKPGDFHHAGMLVHDDQAA